MPRLHVCSLARIDEVVEATGARSMVTLLGPGTPVVRPGPIALERHLHIEMHDIVEDSPGHVLPGADAYRRPDRLRARLGSPGRRC